MQSVIDAFSVEEVDSVRRIAQSVQVAWKKDFRSSIKFFTIGVSTIGGNDLIPGPAGVQSAWNKYQYQDESAQVLSIHYDRELNQPIGGMVKTLADVSFDNTSGRYTPRYSGGSSELYTAVSKPRRPMIINAGMQVNGANMMLPQFVGVTSKPPVIDSRSKTAQFQLVDFIDTLQNKFLDQEVMFTSQRTDQVLLTAFQSVGLSTAQYELDTGINVIPFGLFDAGTKWGDHVNDLVQAENGHLYQDEEGVIRFENRQHWSSFPYFNVQRVISTSQVIDARTPDTSHLINVVEINSQNRQKKPESIIFKSYTGSSLNTLPASTSTEIFVNFEDPVLSMTTPSSSSNTSYFKINTLSDGTGTDISSSVTITKVSRFARAAKITFTNASTSIGFITELVITGRPAQLIQPIYVREKRGISVTAYEEQVYKVDNPFIQDASWANSLANMVLNDYSAPENIQEITIRAVPELQMGDLISWQGHYWRIFGIKTTIDPGHGFIQDLQLLQRAIATYFRIGISTIGGSDKIAP